MSHFKLSIELGNDAMESPAHVAEALRELAVVIDRLDPHGSSAKGKVYDDNGNLVGKWDFTRPEVDDEEDE